VYFIPLSSNRDDVAAAAAADDDITLTDAQQYRPMFILSLFEVKI